MRVFPAGRIGVVLVVCGIAASLGSILTRFIENLEEHLAAQDAEPVRSTAMIRPSDLHVSAPVERVEPLSPVEVDPLVETPVVVVTAAPRREERDERPVEDGARWKLWFPKVVYKDDQKFRGFVGGVSAVQAGAAAPGSAEEVVAGALGGSANLDADSFGACTAGGEGDGSPLQHGVTETAAGSGSASSVFAELNDWQGMPGASTAGSGGSDGEGPVPLGGSGGYRGSYYSSEIHLGPNDEPGLYEFAVLSGQEIRLETQVGEARWETLIESEASGADHLTCGRRRIRLQRYTWAPIRLTVTEASHGAGQSLALLWRRMTDGSSESSLCGTAASPAGSAGPSSEWAAFFRSGWSVVPAQNMYLPGSMQSTSCALAGDAAGGSVPDTVAFGAVEGSTWTCTSGVVASRVGGQLVLDFGSAVCTGADGTRGAPGMTSCWLTVPTGTDPQAFVDRVRAAEGPLSVRALAGSGGCVDVREVTF